MRFVLRHSIALLLAAAVAAAAIYAVPPVADAVTGAAPADAELALPWTYALAAPLSNTLDAMTFLSLPRAEAFLGTWLVLLAAVGVLRRGSALRRVLRAAGYALGFVAFVAAVVLLPRPVPRLMIADPDAAVLDYHAHTRASHDGRSGWTLDRVARWHARQGFTASYVTDHNVVFEGTSESAIPLLPGVEWSLHRLHLVAIGPVRPMERRLYGDLERLMNVFPDLHRQGAIAIASLPEYWRNHRQNLERFAEAGIDGFEIVNCAPKAIGLDAAARAEVVRLALRHDLLLVGASDSHGWGLATCVWNVTVPGKGGLRANRVLARWLALVQDRGPAWAAGGTQPWEMLRALSWPERVSWWTWIALVSIYRGPPRRRGQPAGLGILARSLGRSRIPRRAAEERRR